VTFIHIYAGLIALAAGAAALAVRKGGRLHRETGKIFAYAMFAMAGLGAVLAAAKVFAGESRSLHSMNVVAGVLTFYLVATAWRTARQPSPGRGWIDMAAMSAALAAGAFSVKFGLDAALRPQGTFLGFPATPAFVFGAVALFAALGDLRILAGRHLQGRGRIARHLWRMGLAMFIATASFFLGQAQVLPEPVRKPFLLAIPVVAVLGVMAYWWVRVSFAASAASFTGREREPG